MKENPLINIVRKQKEGNAVGIYSCCSANRYVLEAAIACGLRDKAPVLIESTANQCDQYGGYTGMTPHDFREFVLDICHEYGFDEKLLYLGGDHLGPLTFAHLNEEEAMKEAAELVRCYVAAGFTKIHLDTSMKLADDDTDAGLSDEKIAIRGAYLARVAEETYQHEVLTKDPEAIPPVYVVGSEVPIPGGSTDNGELEVTRVEDFEKTYAIFEKTFRDKGLEEAWGRVIAFVVQPGVEEKDEGCTEYDRDKARALCSALDDHPNIVFEGHSTDYQTRIKLREMVEDGIAILKVGPGLTFAMREGLLALSFIEATMLKDKGVPLSHFAVVLEEEMLKNSRYWKKHYQGDRADLKLKRMYSFSDRCRYYMPTEEVSSAINTLMHNLRTYGIPLNLLSQFMPAQYVKVREGILVNDPHVLVIDHIMEMIGNYLYATKQNEL